MIKRVKAILKQYFDRIRNQKLKENILQAIPFWGGS
jgi:hypothetical protein